MRCMGTSIVFNLVQVREGGESKFHELHRLHVALQK